MIQIKSLRGGARPVGPGAVRVDRRTVWGNPFVLKHEHERPVVLRQHQLWMLNQCLSQQQPYTYERLNKLGKEAKTLWCWCAPKGCHAGNLASAASAAARAASKDEFLAWCQTELANATAA